MEKPYEVFGLDQLAEPVPFFGTKLGKWLGQRIIHLLQLDKVNDVHTRFEHLNPGDAADAMMRDFGITVQVENEERLDQFGQGAFITVSNHSYGAIDGISLTGLMFRHRPDFKIMVNSFLTRIKVFSPNYIGVAPQIDYKKEHKQSSHALRETIQHLKEGHPLALFPAGAVSLYGKNKFISDREWQHSAIKLIKSARVPVVPIYFHGYNNPYYYNLEKIHIALRTLFLAREVFNKQGYTLKVTVGNPITVEEQAACNTLDELSLLLRNRTYELSGDPKLITIPQPSPKKEE